MLSPTDEHLVAAKKALQFFKGRFYLKLIQRGKAKLRTFCDASFGSNDITEFKFITGVIVILSNGPIRHRASPSDDSLLKQESRIDAKP